MTIDKANRQDLTGKSGIMDISKTDTNHSRQGPPRQMLDPSMENNDRIRRGLSCQSSHIPDGDSHKRGDKRETETGDVIQTTSQLENSARNTCSICDLTCLEECVFCDLCGHWSHLDCEKLATKEIAEIKTDGQTDYTCRGCRGTEAMLNSDDLSCDDTEAKSSEPYQCNKGVNTMSEKYDKETNTDVEQLKDITIMQKEYTKKQRDMASEIKKKDANIDDLAKQLATARAYIITLEQKINTMEKSRSLQEKIVNNQQQIPKIADSNITDQRLNLLEQRLNAMEINALKERMEALETRVEACGKYKISERRENENKNAPGECSKGPCGIALIEAKESTNSTEYQHFLGQRPHSKEPPWKLQREPSMGKKKKKALAKKATVAEQNRTQAETQGMQGNIAQIAPIIPYTQNRGQLIQQEHLVSHPPQQIATNSIPLPQSVPTIPIGFHAPQQQMEWNRIVPPQPAPALSYTLNRGQLTQQEPLGSLPQQQMAWNRIPPPQLTQTISHTLNRGQIMQQEPLGSNPPQPRVMNRISPPQPAPTISHRGTFMQQEHPVSNPPQQMGMNRISPPQGQQIHWQMPNTNLTKT